ncbi:PilW family protein [Desulfopila sp. IMCC35008]|uniref:PilW family protein n=1 Tax=Desulfopila sp. IMCC35008 TaxID=2653858 RepID=UPI0013D2841B|nr:type II secretion system protein [Desulfopila sp. IMCC35008]
MAMRRENTQEGFTLIELLVVIAITGVVLAGVTLLFTTTSRRNTAQEMMVEVTQNIRSAKSLMVDEIRSAGTNPENKTRIGFEFDNDDDRFNTDQNSIHFTRDIDNGDGDHLYEPDGDADDPNEDVMYYRVDAAGNILDAGVNTPGRLVRNTGGGGQTVADNVTELQFVYYDESNTIIDPATMTRNSVLSTIRTVEVTIVGQVQNPNITSAANRDWTQQFRVKVRNL